MRVINSYSYAVKYYKQLCDDFINNDLATKLFVNFDDFMELVNDKTTIQFLDPIGMLEILKTGFYSWIKIDGKDLKVYVKKGKNRMDRGKYRFV